MVTQNVWVQFNTLLGSEVRRILRIWPQTLLPPAITTMLYFILFGHLIGQRIGLMEGVHYGQFIAPGLMIMHMMIQSYSNVSSSFFSEKFQRSSENLMVLPLKRWTLILSYVLGGVFRGVMVGAIVFMIAHFFTHFPVKHPILMVFLMVETSVLFALFGFINGLFARHFDDVMVIPSFLLTPMIYLGGVFYSLSILPSFWHKVSLLNPVVYLIDAFRYSTLGVGHLSIYATVGVSFLFIMCFAAWVGYLLPKRALLNS